MRVTDVSRQKAGEMADAVDAVLTDPDGVTDAQILLLKDVRDALRDAERPAPFNPPGPVCPPLRTDWEDADGVD